MKKFLDILASCIAFPIVFTLGVLFVGTILLILGVITIPVYSLFEQDAYQFLHTTPFRDDWASFQFILWHGFKSFLVVWLGCWAIHRTFCEL